jgi:hypothetical protein
MPTPSWDQKRKAIAQVMRGAVNPSGLNLGTAGATFRANPMMAQQAMATGKPAGAPAAWGTVRPNGVSVNGLIGSMQAHNQGANNLSGPMARAMGVGGQPQGLMGQAGGGGQMARMAQMPGFNYVPPPTGPAPVPGAAPGAAGAPMPWTADDKLAFLRGRQTPANAMAYTQALGQGAYDYNRQGRGGGGYTTSGRGGSGSSSSARGGGFRGF